MTKVQQLVPEFEQRQSVPVEGEDQDRLDLPPPYEATASTPASTAAPAVTPPGSSSPAGSVRGEDAAFLPQGGYQRTSPMSVGGSKDEERTHWHSPVFPPGVYSYGRMCLVLEADNNAEIEALVHGVVVDVTGTENDAVVRRSKNDVIGRHLLPETCESFH
ncbi:hypothetical protein CGLO_14777 [Colletotrichum gloeosporioides Cg-14]|uniref:Uncharacterized protein n=1 Tax=Colletotrichum gloeosporioides (strain Cg-14) TaxID=1237896 RepID=T0K081_COLGC|nr:hypothetical protein CGLO_14777 [Colletotrichum gloeosporioides Cg-14]